MRAALISGAGKRLGRAMARALAEDGFAVAAHYHSSASDAESLVAEITAAGGRAVALGAELSDPAAALSLVARAAEALGPISFLVNSASFYDSDSLATVTPESWRKLVDVNLAGPVFVLAGFARQAPEGSAAVNMLDVQITAPSPDFFSYTCAKSGLEAATRLAAMELAPRKIRVNAIAPGLVLPSFGQTPDEFAARQALTPLGAGLGAADIVQAMRFLRDAPQVTGHVLPVDGAQRLMSFANSVLTLA